MKSNILPELSNYCISLLLILFLTFASSGLVSAQTTEPDELLLSGLEKFKVGNYQGALTLFKQAADYSGENPNLEAALFLITKTNLRLGKYGEVLKGAAELITNHSDSPYIDDTMFILAEVYYTLDQEEKAYEKLFRLLEDDVDPRLRALVEIKLRLLFAPVSKSRLLELKRNNSGRSAEFLDLLLEERENIRCILVLKTETDSLANLMVQGLETALRTYRMHSGFHSFKLEVRNAQTELLNLYLDIKNSSETGLVAVVSLLDGAPSLIAASAASHLPVPFFILLDDQPELWKVNDNVWQLPPDLSSLGLELAKFAVDSLGLKRLVTLAPVDDPRSYFAEAFIKEAEAKGAEIAAQEWFYTDALDLGKNFKTIRRLGFRYAFDDSVLTLLEKDSLYLELAEWEYLGEEYLSKVEYPDTTDSLNQRRNNKILYKVETEYFNPDSIPEAENDSPVLAIVDNRIKKMLEKAWRIHQYEVLEKARFQRTEIDSNNIPLDCFDGFVFPLTEDEVDLYVPQYAFYNFNTNLFALRSAFTREHIEKYGHYLKNLKAVGWGSIRDYNDPAYNNMLDNFLNAGLHAPSDEEVLGYDAMNLVLGMLERFSADKSAGLQDSLSFTGVDHDFIFPPNIRNNRKVDFYEFKGRTFVRLQPSVPLKQEDAIEPDHPAAEERN